VDYNFHQYELFDNLDRDKPGSGQKQKLKSSRPLRDYVSKRITLSYESLVFIAIGVIILALVGFILGVERGKSLQNAGLKELMVRDKPIRRTEVVNPTLKFPETPTVLTELDKGKKEGPEKEHNAEEPAPAVQPAPKRFVRSFPELPLEETELYTIQLITYSRKESARKELKKLEKSGCNNLSIVEENGYYKVCAGGYVTQKEAKKNLRRFRMLYRDCFTRLKK